MILGESTAAESACCVAISPDGEMIAAGYSNGVIKLWNSNGREVSTLKADENDSVSSISFSHDGKTLVVGCAYRLQFWSTQEGTIELKMTHVLDIDIRYVAFSPDDHLLAVVNDKNIITLWLKNDRNWLNKNSHLKKLRTLKHEDSHDKLIAKACFFSNSSQTGIITYNYGNTIQFWDCIDKFSGYCQEDGNFYGHADEIISIALSGDSKTIATTSLDGTIKVWSSSGFLLETLYSDKENCDPSDRVGISQDGQTVIAILKIGKVVIWRRNKSFRYDLIHEEEELVSEFALSPDGAFYLTVNHDSSAMKIFGLRGNRPQFIFEVSNQVKGRFDSSGELIVSVDTSKRVNIWKFRDDAFIKVDSDFGTNIRYANFFRSSLLCANPKSDDQDLLITLDETSEFNVWKVSKKESERHFKWENEADIIDIQFAEKTILILSESSSTESGTKEFYIDLCSLNSINPKTIRLTSGELSAISVNLGCQVIAVADLQVSHYENRVRLWNLSLDDLEQKSAALQAGVRSKLEIIHR
jgi:WD40 repeat protein